MTATRQSCLCISHNKVFSCTSPDHHAHVVRRSDLLKPRTTREIHSRPDPTQQKKQKAENKVTNLWQGAQSKPVRSFLQGHDWGACVIGATAQRLCLPIALVSHLQTNTISRFKTSLAFIPRSHPSTLLLAAIRRKQRRRMSRQLTLFVAFLLGALPGNPRWCEIACRSLGWDACHPQIP
jgi:hypothetical protein